MLAPCLYNGDNFYMPVPKANYHEIAGTFDQGRQLDQAVINTWLGLVKEHGNLVPGSKILDLGCGTGRFAIPFAAELKLDTTGADAYSEMLDVARDKPGGDLVDWDLQDADDLQAYASNSFDAVFMSHLLHHVDSPEGVVASSRRILRPMGALLIRYGATEHILEDVEHKFFEGTTEIDAERTLTTAATEALLREQGFLRVKSEVVTQHTYSSAQDHVERAGTRFTSVLHLIPDEVFEKGLRNLAGYANQHPHDPWLVDDTLTLTVGYKQPAD